MSHAGLSLNPGDEALTDFNGEGMTLVKIVERIAPTHSESRVCFRVSPSLKNGDETTLYDAAWFEPVPKSLI